MIQVDAKKYTTGAEMIAAARAARNRVINPAKRGNDTFTTRARKSVEFVTVDDRDGAARLAGYTREFYRKQKAAIFAKEAADKKAHAYAEMKRKREEMIAAMNALREAENRRKSKTEFDDITSKYRTINVISLSDDLPYLASDYVKRRAIELGVTYQAIIGEIRLRSIVKLRHLIVGEVYTKYPHLSLPAIGRVMKRDHTSIMSALRKIGVRSA